jgi:eukaryotic-like serine/threonine-protein kinase
VASAVISSSPAAKIERVARAPLQVGAVIGERYRVVKLLGEGATGTVYAAEHIPLRKKVAIKILHPELTDTPEGVARFEREAMATSRIEHENVAAAVDFGKLADGSMYLALEYVEGRSLRSEIVKGPFGVTRALHVARQIASAIAAAQSLGIVHRDIKPENVMLVSKGADTDFVKVLDFGIARVPVDEGSLGGPQALTKAGAVFGTAEYMPPEQGIGQKVDSRADLYALGVMLFEMVAGVRPYGARADLGILAQQITQPLPTFAERAKGIDAPASLERLVHRLLAKRPQERIQKADDVVNAIDALAYAEASGSTSPAASSEEPLPAFALATQLPGALAAQSAPAAPAEDGSNVPSRQEPATGRTEAVSNRPRTSVAVAAASISKSVGQTFSKISAVVDMRRRALPEPIKAWLVRVPAGLLVVVIIGLILLALGSIGTWLHHAQVSRAVAAASASALAAEQLKAQAAASASAQASPIFDAEASRASAVDGDSKDPNTLLDLAEKKLREGKELEAVNGVVQVLGKHPDRRNDPRVANILFKSASSTAKGVANTTYSLLEGAMAAPGAEIMYQLAIDRSLPPYVRSRAEKWLHSPQFDRASSDALRVAAKIRFAPTCEAKHAFLPMAAKAGGGAALTTLHELQSQSGCGLSGKNDCYPCLRGDSQLGDAIAQIEARLKQ